jgi:hypothetical protein
MPPALYTLVILEIGSHSLGYFEDRVSHFAQASLDCDLPNLRVSHNLEW